MAKAKTGKPATTKSLGKTAVPAKSPKPSKKVKEPLNRKERREAAWLKRTKKKEAQQAVTEVAAKISGPGLTYAQLEASGLIAKPKPPAGLTLEQIFLEVVAEQAQQYELEAAGKVVSLPGEPPYYPWMTVTVEGEEIPLVGYEDEQEPLGIVALRNAITVEVQQLLAKTDAVFNAFRSGSSAETQLAVGETFEKEGESPLGLRLAEVILASRPAMAVGNFLEEVHDQVGKLQLILSAYDPEGELEKLSRRGLIDEVTVARLKKAAGEEAVRLNIAERLSGLIVEEIDPAVAALIAEAAQAAEVKRQERADFRKTLSQKLEQRKERGGRKISKSSEEPGDEELVQFLVSHRDDLAAVKRWLPVHIREQVDDLFKDEERRKPLRRLIAAATADANRLWADLKFRLVTGADNPETTVAQNAAAMKDLLSILAQIRNLRIQLGELDKSQPVAKEDVLEPLLRRDTSWRGSFPMATVLAPLAKALAAQAVKAKALAAAQATD